MTPCFETETPAALSPRPFDVRRPSRGDQQLIAACLRDPYSVRAFEAQARLAPVADSLDELHAELQPDAVRHQPALHDRRRVRILSGQHVRSLIEHSHSAPEAGERLR